MKSKLEPIEDPAHQDPRYEQWVASRPEPIRKLAAEFPIGSVLTDHEGEDWYIIGWGESENDPAAALILSQTWLGTDYDRSVREKTYMHVRHIRDGEAVVRKVAGGAAKRVVGG